MDPTVVKYSRRLKKISLQRYLVSNLAYEEVSKKCNRILIALFDNQLWLERKCSTDPDFSRKFGKSLEELSKILKEVNLSRGLSFQTINRLRSRIKENLKDFLVPPRNYKTYKGRFDGCFKVVTLLPPKDHNKNLPPKRIIGVGYRDKGTARDPAKDGSPSWQEVASSAGQLKFWREKIRNAKTIDQLTRAVREAVESNNGN